MQDYSRNLTQLAKGAGLAIFGKFAGRFLAVVGDILAARLLGPVLFGLYAIGWTLLRIIGLMVHLGLPNGVLKFIPVYENDPASQKKLINLSIALVVMVGVVVGALLFSLAPWLAEQVYQKPPLTDIFRLFALAIPLFSLLTLLSSISRSRSNMIWSVSLEDIGQPFLALILLVGIYIFVGVWLTGVILTDLVSYLIAAIICFIAIRKMFQSLLKAKGPATIQISEVMRFSIPTALAGTFTVFVFWIDRMLVGYFLSAADNGIYQAVSQVSVLFVLVLAAFNAILSPIFANLHAHGDLRQLEEMFRVGTKWGFYISIPFFLVFCFAPVEILSSLYGSNYNSGATTLVVLAVGQLVNVATGSVGTLLSMTGYQKIWLVFSTTALVINLLMCIILIPRFGILGAAVSTSISLAAMNIGGVFKARKLLGIWPYDLRYIKGLLASLGCLILLGMFRWIFSGNAVIYLILVTLIGFVSFLGIVLVQGLDHEDKNLLGLFRARILKSE